MAVRATEVTDEICSNEAFENHEVMNDAEAKRNKIVEKLIVCPVTKPNEKKDTVENEIRDKLEAKGVKVITMKTKSTSFGDFNGCVV